MLRGPGNALRGSLEHLSSDDRELLVANLHDLMQVVGVLVIDVTAREDENTHEDRMTVAKARTKGMNLIEGLGDDGAADRTSTARVQRGAPGRRGALTGCRGGSRGAGARSTILGSRMFDGEGRRTVARRPRRPRRRARPGSLSQEMYSWSRSTAGE